MAKKKSRKLRKLIAAVILIGLVGGTIATVMLRKKDSMLCVMGLQPHKRVQQVALLASPLLIVMLPKRGLIYCSGVHRKNKLQLRKLALNKRKLQKQLQGHL